MAAFGASFRWFGRGYQDGYRCRRGYQDGYQGASAGPAKLVAVDANEFLAGVGQVDTERAAAAEMDAYRNAVAASLLALLAGPGDPWRERAACRGMDVNLFHRRMGSAHTQANAVCARCTVRSDCLESVMSLPADVDGAGIFGGLTVVERRELRRRRKAAAA